MATINRGILGGFSGKVGSITGTSWKGIEVMKARPLSVANPRSAGQVAQRSKMSNTVALAVQINASCIKPLWDRFAVKQSGYNAFVQANIALFEGISPSPAADFALAKGKMSANDGLQASASQLANELEITWTSTVAEGFKLQSDEAFAIAIDTVTGKVLFSAAEQIRSSGSLVISYDDFTQGHGMEVYLAFRRADGTIVSDTNYVHIVVGA